MDTVAKNNGLPGFFHSKAAVLAVLGFALTLFSTESWRIPQVVGLSPSSSTLIDSGVVSVITLVLLALIYRFLTGRLADNPIVVPAVAVLAAVTISCYLLRSTVGAGMPLLLILSSFHFAFSYFLLVLWVEVVLNDLPSDASSFMIPALLATAAIQLLFAVLRIEIVQLLIPAVPLLSAVCFFLYRRYSSGQETASEPVGSDAGEEPSANEVETEEGGVGLQKPHARTIAYYVFLVLVWACCGMLFNILFNVWAYGTYSGESVSIIVQVFSALGSAAAAGLVALLARPLERGITEVLVVVLALSAVLLANTESQLSLVYLIPFNAAQKLIFVAFVRNAFAMKSPRQGIALFCVLLASYRVGLTSYRKLSRLLSGEPLSIPVDSINYLVVAFCAAVLVAFFVIELSSSRPQKHGGAAPEDDGEPEGQSPALTEQLREGAFRYHLMNKYGLTPRETDILLRYEAGATVKAIAQEEFVSESTIKSHLTNVYPKIGASGRKDAMERIQEERTAFFGE